jgi:hypothetical protein
VPSSRHHQITKIVEVIVALRPNSVLDIGVGFGKYGVLAREYLEMWDNESYEKSAWRYRIDGIEAFEPYLTPLHNYVYDHIYIGDACDIVPRLDHKYDLVLLIDVLEHMEKEVGTALLNQLRQKADGILICVPNEFTVQNDLFGNPYEIHRTFWSKRELRAFTPNAIISDPYKNICLIGSDAVERWDGYRQVEVRRRIKRFFPTLAKLYRNLRTL